MRDRERMRESARTRERGRESEREGRERERDRGARERKRGSASALRLPDALTLPLNSDVMCVCARVFLLRKSVCGSYD